VGVDLGGWGVGSGSLMVSCARVALLGLGIA